MSPLPSAARAVVEAFIAQLGLPARPAPDGSYGLTFTNSGRLTINAADDGRRILVSLARRPARLDAAALQKAMGVAGIDPSTSTQIHVGCTGDGDLHVSTALDAGQVDLPTLDLCFQRLADLHDRAA